MAHNRAWYGKCQYPGLKPFFAGTVWMREEAPFHEIEAEFNRLFDKVFPTRPKLVALSPGQIVIIDHKDS